MASIARFYVYALARPVKVKRSVQWRVFYVGKGQRQRVYHHENEAKRGHRCHKCSIIRKVWREGGQIQRYILLTTDNEQEALDYEKEMIAFYGRKNLCNHTDGGEGVSNPSEEVRRKIGQAHKGRPGSRRGVKASEETRRKMSAALKGRRNSPEAIEKMRQKLTGRKMRPDLVEKQRQRMKGNTYGVGKGKKGKIIPEDQRRRTSETLKAKAPWRGKNHTRESIEKMGKARAKPHIVTLPSGEHIEVQHLKAFCADHGLAYGSLMSASNEGRPYRGYFAKSMDVKPPKARRASAKTYDITLPNGEQTRTTHLETFCKENNLNYRSFCNYIKAGQVYMGYFGRRVTGASP